MRQGSNRHQPAGEEDRALPSFNRLKDISADRLYKFKRSQMAHMSSPALFVGPRHRVGSHEVRGRLKAKYPDCLSDATGCQAVSLA